MACIIVSLAAFAASAITLFSGFGLGTMLLPVFAVFFPLDIAVALTAIVHFLNNLFKLVLVGKHADRSVILRFGLPAVLAAFIGAQVLIWLSDLKPFLSYQLAGRLYEVTLLDIIIAVLIILFALWEVLPTSKNITFKRTYLSVGGVFSGFFGGLSGHQGALRSPFLLRSNLTEQGYVATGVVIAVMVDIARLTVYINHFSRAGLATEAPLLIAATLSAFTGAFIASRLLKKVTFTAINVLVTVLLIFIALGLGSGLI